MGKLEEAEEHLQLMFDNGMFKSEDEPHIEVALNAIELLQKFINGEEFSARQLKAFNEVIKKFYIHKAVVKDKIEELNVVENAEALEDILDRKNYSITELVQFVLQELLEEDK